MKRQSVIVGLLGFTCSLAIADEPISLQRFSIVQATSRTILLDRVSGTTWALEESPHLRWKAIPRDADSSLLPSAEAKRDLDTSKLTLVANGRKAVVAGETTFLQASVTNPTSTSIDGFTITFDPGEAAVIRATSGALKREDDRCVWEVDLLDAGESRVFEAQVRFSKELVERTTELTWVLRDRAGDGATRSVGIAVKEPGLHSDGISVQSKVDPVIFPSSNNGG
jgi:hypothetical protein